MRIIAKPTLRRRRIRGARTPRCLSSCGTARLEAAEWARPADVKGTPGDASILNNSRVVFNISANEFGLAVRIDYPYRVVHVRFAGTHEEYDAIGVEAI